VKFHFDREGLVNQMTRSDNFVEMLTPKVITTVLEILAKSRNPQDVCEMVVRTKWSAHVLGCQIVQVGRGGELIVLGSFGQACFTGLESESIWSNHPVSEVLENNTVQFSVKNNGKFLYIPYSRLGKSAGLVLVRLKDDLAINLLSKPDLDFLSGAAGLFLQLEAGWQAVSPQGIMGNFDFLSSRQKDILERMSQGDTNHKIGSALHLSDSTIRQETMRIYKILKVASRKPAMLLFKNITDSSTKKAPDAKGNVIKFI
jgi:DNA-binding CsgD family transcriptional regulator